MAARISLSEAVISAVAEAKGLDPLEVGPPLAEVIDPDALDSLFRGGVGTVTFEYAGYEVTVDDEGDVSLTAFAN